MADEYIRRKDAAKLLGYIFGVDVVRRLHEVPAADVTPVVRCKDCQNWKRNVGLTDSPNGHCFEHDIDTNGRDFCSYGARMRQAKREAEKLICEDREQLVTPSCEGERGMEGA